jgi:hypothetical protein
MFVNMSKIAAIKEFLGNYSRRHETESSKKFFKKIYIPPPPRFILSIGPVLFYEQRAYPCILIAFLAS